MIACSHEFERPIEIGRNNDVVRNKAGIAKHTLQFRRELDENNSGAGFARRLLDLGKALRCR